METHLILRAIKIASPQGKNMSIVLPQEEHDDNVKSICTDNLSPHSFGEDIQRRHECESRSSWNGRSVALSDIDSNENTTADNTQNQEYIPHHLRAS